MGHTPTEFILLTREPVYVVVAVSGGGRRR